MTDPFDLVTTLVADALEALKASGELTNDITLDGVTVEAPRDTSHGDVATNVALVVAGRARAKPRDIAARFAERLGRHGDVEAVEVAGPGFINLRLSDGFWQRQVAGIIAAGNQFGRSTEGAGRAVNVEYVSANPTGPMHVGHCRGAVVGDAISNLLEWAGFAVTREYYVNDAGSQVDTLARSAHLRYQQALGRDIGGIPEGFYPGDYLVPVGEALAQEFGDRYVDSPEPEWLQLFKERASDAMMEQIRADLAQLGIRHDVFFSERSLHRSGRIDELLSSLEERGLVYEGVLEKPKGESADDWEPREQTLFAATRFGDDTDRALKKSDGSWTYFAADIAYHFDKLQRGFHRLVDIFGADHGGYVKRMQAAVAALSDGQVPLDIRLCQMVRLYKNGEPYKMSKRAGSFVTLADVVDEVGKDVVRFMMLTRRSDAQLDFDFAKAVEQSKDNPVFYLQYAHARVSSLLRRHEEQAPGGTAELAGEDGRLLVQPEELELIKIAARFPRLVRSAALAEEPHRVAYYLGELAAGFHSTWNRGNDDPSRRFLVDDAPELTRQRLALALMVRQVIRNGLDIMGVDPVEELN